jgi:hypothetical protein
MDVASVWAAPLQMLEVSATKGSVWAPIMARHAGKWQQAALHNWIARILLLTRHDARGVLLMGMPA